MSPHPQLPTAGAEHDGAELLGGGGAADHVVQQHLRVPHQAFQGVSAVEGVCPHQGLGLTDHVGTEVGSRDRGQTEAGAPGGVGDIAGTTSTPTGSPRRG